jgi:hypothetical protein
MSPVSKLDELLTPHGWTLLPRLFTEGVYTPARKSEFNPVEYRGDFTWANGAVVMKMTIAPVDPDGSDHTATEVIRGLLELAGYTDVSYAPPSVPGSKYKPVLQIMVPAADVSVVGTIGSTGNQGPVGPTGVI